MSDKTAHSIDRPAEGQAGSLSDSTISKEANDGMESYTARLKAEKSEGDNATKGNTDEFGKLTLEGLEGVGAKVQEVLSFDPANLPQILDILPAGSDSNSKAAAFDPSFVVAENKLPEAETKAEPEPAKALSKAEEAAKAIRKATEKDDFIDLGTDEDAIYKALEGLTADEIKDLREIYKRDYKVELDDELIDELDKDELNKAFGLMKGKDKAEEKPKESESTPRDGADQKLEAAKKDLESALDDKVKDGYWRGEFKKQIEQFEKRTPPVSAADRTAFYKELSTLVKAGDDPTRTDLPKQDTRNKLALQILEQANRPNSVDQGNHDTCGAAALESRMYTQNPAAVARVITEAATKGTVTPLSPADSSPIKIDPSLLRPDTEGQASLIGKIDGERTYASQLFQAAAVSSVVEGFHQVRPTPGDKADTGERDKHGKFSGLTDDQVQQIEKNLTNAEKPADILRKAHPAEQTAAHPWVKDEMELKIWLAELKRTGKLPAMVAVDATKEPFKSDTVIGKTGSTSGGHYVTVTDYNEADGTVAIDNQWGVTKDHSKNPNDSTAVEKERVKVEDLYKGLADPPEPGRRR